MDTTKMSETIRLLSQIRLEEVFAMTTGKTPTLTQLADVTEYIEKKYGQSQVVHTVAQAPVATIVKAEPKRAFTKSKKPMKTPEFLANWQDPDVQMFLDIALDGQEHVFTFAELNSIMPFSKMSFSVFSHYLRKTARRRGMVTVNFKRDFKARKVYITAHLPLA